MIAAAVVLRAEALFVSSLQPSDGPSPALVEQTVEAVILRHGAADLAGEVAFAYGRDQVAAAARMRWAVDLVAGPVGAVS